MDAAEALLAPDGAQTLDAAHAPGDEPGEPGRAIFLSLEQRSGRGRRGRTWHSEAAAGVYVTYLLYGGTAPERLEGVSLIIGIAVRRALRMLGVDAGLKWPNDIVVSQPGGAWLKLGGVLVDAARCGEEQRVSVGIGLNLSQREFPAPLSAISIVQALGREVDYFLTFALLSSHVLEAVEQFRREGLRAFSSEWQEASVLEGRRVRLLKPLEEEHLEGEVLGISSDGGLRLMTSGGEHVVYAGEVTYAGEAI